MKVILSLITAMVVANCATGTNHSPASRAVVGIYVGSYTADAFPEQGALYYSIVLYDDGTLLTRGKGGDGTNLFSEGRYTIKGNRFSAILTSFMKSSKGIPVTQSINATYSEKGALIDGLWKDISNPFGARNKGRFSTLYLQRAS